MSAATLGTLLLVAIVALAATCAALVYLEHRRDRAWDAETDVPEVDHEWLREVAEASDTPLFDATAAHVARHAMAGWDEEWAGVEL